MNTSSESYTHSNPAAERTLPQNIRDARERTAAPAEMKIGESLIVA